jgi:hypothetical protein
MDNNLLKAGRITLEAAAARLRANNFACQVFETGAEACAYVLKLAGPGKKAGLGGSMTLRELGLPEKLAAAGAEIITHLPGMSPAEKLAVWLRAQAADLYLASPQAVTLEGELLLLDGNGNRAAACIYGPGKVLLIAGVNKVVADIAAGERRSREAALPNNLRLSKDNPCVKAGRCVDCASPQRICNVLVTMYKKPASTDVEVLLVNEPLGY